MRQFENFVCIDWSGEAVARPRGLAVARCEIGSDAPILQRPGKGWSRSLITDRMLHQAEAKANVLIGVDFSPALPFVDRDAFFPGWPRTPHAGPALWELVDRLSENDPYLGCSSFVDHVEARRHFRRHGGREGDLFGGGAGRMRVVENQCRKTGLGAAQSCFNLVGPAQVGKSSLTGMRMLHQLNGKISIWPFNPVPDEGPVIVEIYTTIAARAASVRGGSKLRTWEALDAALSSPSVGSRVTKRSGPIDDHSSDAVLTAAWLRRASMQPALWERPPSRIADTEGWTFGVPYPKGPGVPV